MPPGAGGLSIPIWYPNILNRQQQRHGIPPPYMPRKGISQNIGGVVECIANIRNAFMEVFIDMI